MFVVVDVTIRATYLTWSFESLKDLGFVEQWMSWRRVVVRWAEEN